jgi:hypothetical protein
MKQWPRGGSIARRRTSNNYVVSIPPLALFRSPGLTATRFTGAIPYVRPASPICANTGCGAITPSTKAEGGQELWSTITSAAAV